MKNEIYVSKKVSEKLMSPILIFNEIYQLFKCFCRIYFILDEVDW